jgi:hypothetical protein
MNITTYTVIAVLDNKTCEVCSYLHGSVWSVEEAVIKVYDMLIAEADEAQVMNPFPPRSTPKDYEDPTESPYMLPPYHPRCRCNVRSEHAVTAMPQEVLARPFDAGPKPTDKLLNKVYRQYMDTPSSKQVQEMIDAGYIPAGSRSLNRAERKVAREAWESMPLEVKKWSSRNKDNFQLLIEEGENITSRVQGNRIYMNSKFFDSAKYGPQPIQHELRHALVNPSVVDSRGGGSAIWRELSNAAEDTKKGWRSPTHANMMYQLNGNQGVRAVTAASDEFIAMIGDHYRPGMSMDELITSVRHKSYGIDVSDSITSTVVSSSSRWSAREAKNACEYWWRTVDVDNNTLLSKKQLLSKMNYKPTNAATHHIAINNEIELRDSLRAAGIKKVNQEGDNAPFDVWIGADPEKWYSGKSKEKPWAVIEVKTIIRAKNNKITMPKDALVRKRKELRKFGKKNTSGHTIVIDERTGKIYYRDDVGSFRLSAMEEVTYDDIQRKFGGKATGLIREQHTIVEAPDYIEALAEAEANRKKIKGTPTVALSGLKNMKPLGDGKDGINVSYTAQWSMPPKVKGGKRRVKTVLYKPIQGESWIASDLPPDQLGLPGEGWTFSGGVPDSIRSEWIEQVGAAPEDLIRPHIGNVNTPLAYREMLASEVANEIKFKNLKFAKTHVVTEKGKPVGVMSEWQDNFIEEGVYAADYPRTYKPLTKDQKYEAAVYDYLIGNTDRHNLNYMRNPKTGNTLMIDHGYSFPDRYKYDTVMSPDFDEDYMDGLSYYWKAEAARGMDKNIDAFIDYEEKERIRKKLVKMDVQGMADRYNLTAGERQAFEYRRRVLVHLMDADRDQTGEYMWYWFQAGEFPLDDDYDLDYLKYILDSNYADVEDQL